MTRVITVVLACVLVAACDKDPARSLKLTDPSSGHVAEANAGAMPPAPTPRPADVDVATGAAPAPQPAAPPAQQPAAPAVAAVPARSDGEPSRNGRARGDATAGRSTKAATAPAHAWHPPGCPVPSDATKGPSTLTVTGPCAFSQHARFACESSGDDLYISTTRKAAGGATLMVYINVEKYKGPGEYANAQMFVGVQDRTNIYRWSSDTVKITVEGDHAAAVLPPTRLDAEPVLIDCSGPMNNYQCGGRNESSKVFMASAHTASGTLQCETEVAAK